LRWQKLQIFAASFSNGRLEEICVFRGNFTRLSEETCVFMDVESDMLVGAI
jgi:hypothetical protein